MPKVSVVMPSYNHAPYVREAVESVLKQSYSDLELIITDDGSIDGTADIVRSFTDPRVRFHAFERNQGACIAMNDAINRSSGEYVAVLNSDDYFLPGKIERQVAFLDAHREIGAVFGLPEFVDEHGVTVTNRTHPFAGTFTAINRSRREWLRHFFAHGNCLCHPTVMIRRECYDAIGLFDPLLMQLPDFDLWIRLCLKYDIHILQEKLTAFRILGSDRNVSAPAPAVSARSAWELVSVLKHYSEVPELELKEIFSDLATIQEIPASLAIAMEALRIDRPGYRQYGLGLMRECLRQQPGALPYKNYFRLVGETDPYATRFSWRPFEYLVRSAPFKVLRSYTSKLQRYFRRHR